MGCSESEEPKEPKEPLKSFAIFGDEYVVPKGKNMLLHMQRDDRILANLESLEVTDINNDGKVVLKVVGNAISSEFAWNQCNAVTDANDVPLFIHKSEGLFGEETGIYQTTVTDEVDENGKKILKQTKMFNLETEDILKTAWTKGLKNVHGQNFDLYGSFGPLSWEHKGEIKIGKWGTNGETVVRFLTAAGVPGVEAALDSILGETDSENDYFLEIHPGMDYVAAVSYLIAFTQLRGPRLSKMPGTE